MHIYGFMLVKDEEDIIEQTLLSLRKHGNFRRIFVFDNLSSDRTYEIARKFASDTLIVRQVPTEFSDQLKFDLIAAHRDQFAPGDWITTLDGDELYCSPLADCVAAAESEGANCIEHNTVQFYLTEAEDSYDFDPAQAASEQRRHYLLNYGELRAFRYAEGMELSADSTKGRHQHFIKAHRNFPVLHFQYRSRRQVERRAQLRLQNNRHSGNWGHVQSTDWTSYRVKSRYLHHYDGSIKTGLPPGTNLYRVPDSPAYTMANLLWMKRRGYLTPEQEAFFAAPRWLRLARKVF